MNQSRSVTICRRDHARLQNLIRNAEPTTVKLLHEELDSAIIVADDELPDDVVSMGSVVTFDDVETSESSTIVLVYPDEADARKGRISVLAPVGAALVGLRVGETIEWPVPVGGTRHLRVAEVQPPREPKPL